VKIYVLAVLNSSGVLDFFQFESEKEAEEYLALFQNKNKKGMKFKRIDFNI
jgi:hypothetical protein